MSQTAAHLVDHVIPHVPVRQCVLSLPIPLRVLLAAQPELVTPVLQVVQRCSAWSRGICPNCGDFKIIAAILERPLVEKNLTHLGMDPQPPPKGRAREAGHDFAA